MDNKTVIQTRLITNHKYKAAMFLAEVKLGV